MKSAKLPVRWTEGLHLRHAARIVRCAQGFTSGISLRLSDEVADAGSILSIVTLCALMGSVIDVEVSGEDEQQALEAIVEVFSTDLDGTGQG
jgi:phosphotransferase system HPr (HPr) family protein